MYFFICIELKDINRRNPWRSQDDALFSISFDTLLWEKVAIRLRFPIMEGSAPPLTVSVLPFKER